MAGLDPSTPSIARVYDYLLGGKDHFPADRAMAEQLLGLVPEVADALRDNRQFVTRAASWVACQGVSQFIDLGCGMPTPPTIADAAGAIMPGLRVAWVDNDPVVLTHLNAEFYKEPGAGVINGDIRDTDAVIKAVSRVVDLAAPVCLVMGSLLHFFPAEEARDLLRAYIAPLAPGSYLVLSMARPLGDAATEAAHSYSASGSRLYPYSEEQIASLLARRTLELVPPGMIAARWWLPGRPGTPPAPARAGEIIVAVARVIASR